MSQAVAGDLTWWDGICFMSDLAATSMNLLHAASWATMFALWCAQATNSVKFMCDSEFAFRLAAALSMPQAHGPVATLLDGMQMAISLHHEQAHANAASNA